MHAKLAQPESAKRQILAVSQRIALVGVMLTIVCRMNASGPPGQKAPAPLRPDEYDIAALIYNEELSALGNKALYPICIYAGTSTKPLVRYLRRGGFEISDPSLCEPAMLPGGQHHPKDYPHGLRIFLDQPLRDTEGLVSIRAQSVDLTLRPGEHFALTLRDGTYRLKRDVMGEWKIDGYTKEYDFKDDKKVNCDPTASPAAAH